MPLTTSETHPPQLEQVTTAAAAKPETTSLKTPTQAEMPLIKILETKDPADPDTTFKHLAGEAKEEAEKKDYTPQKQAEEKYLSDTRVKFEGQLDTRYADEKTGAEHVREQVKGYVDGIITKASSTMPPEDALHLHHETTATELTDRPFDEETRSIILTKAQERVTLLFNSEHASKNPEKHKIMAEQTQQYLDLLVLAKAEGSLSKDITADTILQLVDENIAKLAYQDRAATENWLGDHGVRHLVDHNIKVSMKLADELVRNGQAVTAMDRLILHQVMIDHDMGYAMDVVRDPINQSGFGADGGHNVLAAKFIREQAEDPNSTFSKVFSSEQTQLIHEGILHHDSRSIKFNLNDSGQQAGADNLYSIIHAADNTHAFEDKLPEVLYSHPDTLRIMRLMKTAGEIGDSATIDSLRTQLIAGIDSNSSFSDDDKTALKVAAGQISAGSYVKSVPRICGNKPEYSIDSNGFLTVGVTESAIHQEVVGMFAQGQNEQLQKFIGDVTGIKNVDLGTADSVSSPEGTVIIKMRTGEGRAAEKTDYQEQIDALIADPKFKDFVIADSKLDKDQKIVEYDFKYQYKHKLNSKGEIVEEYKKQINLDEEYKDISDLPSHKKELLDRIKAVREARKQVLETYLRSKSDSNQTSEVTG